MVYDLCEGKCEDSIAQKTKLNDKGTQTDIRPKLVPRCRKCRKFEPLLKKLFKEENKNKKNNFQKILTPFRIVKCIYFNK